MIPDSVRIFVCTQPQDMRRAFDGLALAAREVLGVDPLGGAMFVFTNRRTNRLKVLWWDGNGFCLLYKRLHRALFAGYRWHRPARCVCPSRRHRRTWR